jgi:hypothetical protein
MMPDCIDSPLLGAKESLDQGGFVVVLIHLFNTRLLHSFEIQHKLSLPHTLVQLGGMKDL